MEETLVFIDAGFFSKVKKKFGEGKYLKIDLISYSELLAKKEQLKLKKIFYYNAPPFQSETQNKEEEERKKNYDKFKQKLIARGVIFREGRCQRLKIDGKFHFAQKAVDVYVAMDLTNVPIEYPSIKKIIMIACDSDFVPVIKNLESKGIKTILYTYYDKIRDSAFSRSNHLIKSVYKYKLIKKEDLDCCKINI